MTTEELAVEIFEYLDEHPRATIEEIIQVFSNHMDCAVRTALAQLYRENHITSLTVYDRMPREKMKCQTFHIRRSSGATYYEGVMFADGLCWIATEYDEDLNPAKVRKTRMMDLMLEDIGSIEFGTGDARKYLDAFPEIGAS